MKPFLEQFRAVLVKTLSAHLPVVLVTFFSAFLIFTNLGHDYLWSDEADTAVFASNILKYGVPKGWDGLTYTDSDMGSRLNQDLVMVSHPWVQYYVTAASFWLFGETPFAARLPFAVAGWLTIPLLYFLILRQVGDRRAALSAALLLMLSVQFLIYTRQCRNYSLNIFLTLLLALLFFQLTSRRGMVFFSVTAIALFHTHPIALAPLSVMGLLTLVYKPFASLRKGYWLSVPAIAVFTLPWFFLARTGYEENTDYVTSIAKLVPRAAQFLVECGSVTPLLGMVVLLAVVLLRNKWSVQPAHAANGKNASKAHSNRSAPPVFSDGERALLLLVGGLIGGYTALMLATQSRMVMWQVGLRYTPAIIPLVLAATGVLISKASGGNWKVWVALVLVLGFTKLGRITPWSFWQEETASFDSNRMVSLHVPPKGSDRIFRTAIYDHIKDLFHENHGTVAWVCDYLKDKTRPEDILITNYGWESFYFHTRLPQGLKVLPGYPGEKAARFHKLPEYVFSVDGARWIVWRFAWGDYLGYDWRWVTEELARRGALLHHMGSVPETIWENRENIHFRRFPGGKYKFAWHEGAPDAQIFRVEWPSDRANDAAGRMN